MTITGKLQPSLISLKGCKILSSKINSDLDFEGNHIDKFDFDVNYDLSYDLPRKVVKAELIFEIRTRSKGKNKPEASGLYHFVFLFSVENLAELTAIQADNSLEVDPELAYAITSISYSTSRGILMTRVQGTALQDFILPIINPVDILKF